MNTWVKITKSLFGRYFIQNAVFTTLAWSGSRWVEHLNGVGSAGMHISNFETWAGAAMEASNCGFTVVDGEEKTNVGT